VARTIIAEEMPKSEMDRPGFERGATARRICDVQPGSALKASRTLIVALCAVVAMSCLGLGDPGPAELPLGESFYEATSNRAMGWNSLGTEFVDVRPVSPAEAREMPRSVVAVSSAGRHRTVLTFPLAVVRAHHPLLVAGGALYAKVAADGDWNIVRFPLDGGVRDTIARHTMLGSAAVTPDERYVVFTSARVPGAVPDSITTVDRVAGSVRGFAMPAGVDLIAIAPDGASAVFSRGGQTRDIALIDLHNGAQTAVATIAVGASATLTYWRAVAWRPGGPSIAFTRHDGTKPSELWVVERPGTMPRLVAVAPPAMFLGNRAWPGSVYPLAWLEGGDRLLVVVNAPATPKTTVGSYRVADGVFAVVDSGTAATLAPVEPNVGSAWPNLAPDSSRVVVRDARGFRLLTLR
jgi:hypothetical protein